MTDTKLCPYCGEEIKAGAIKCKHCHSFLDNNKQTKPVGATQVEQATKETIGRQQNVGAKKPIWRRWWAWVVAILIVIIFISSLGGGDDAIEPPVTNDLTLTDTDTESMPAADLPSFEVVNVEDLTFSNVIRFNWNVVVNEPVDQEQLIQITEHLVEVAKSEADFNALSIMYYDYEEYIGFGYTLGSADFAPRGDWSKADTVTAGDYQSMSIEYSLRAKDWSQQLTSEEVKIWRAWEDAYYEMLDTGLADAEEVEEKAFELVAEEYNLTTAEVEAIVRKQIEWSFLNIQ